MFTLEQEGQKSGGATGPPGPPCSAAYATRAGSYLDTHFSESYQLHPVVCEVSSGTLPVLGTHLASSPGPESEELQ